MTALGAGKTAPLFIDDNMGLRTCSNPSRSLASSERYMPCLPPYETALVSPSKSTQLTTSGLRPREVQALCSLRNCCVQGSCRGRT